MVNPSCERRSRDKTGNLFVGMCQPLRERVSANEENKRLALVIVSLLVCMLTLPVGAAQVWKSYHARWKSVDKAAYKLAELVNERTNGRIKIEIFPASQLGSQVDMYELLRMGAMQMMWAGDYVAIRAVPEFEGVHWPYMFKNEQHAPDFMETPLGQTWREETRKRTGIRTIGWVIRSARHLTTNKPVRSVADVKGMKLRSAENPIYIQGFGAMGLVVTLIPFNELFTALQQGVVEAQENPFDMIYGHGLYEVQNTWYSPVTNTAYTSCT